MVKKQLHPYQIDIAKFIVGTPLCGVFADMGLGKTLSTAVALRVMMKKMPENQRLRRVVIFAPKFVALQNWPRELKSAGFSDNEIFSLTGVAPDKRQAIIDQWQYSDCGIMVVNFEMARALDKFTPHHQFCVVVDELTRIKRNGVASKAIGRLCKYAQRFIGLTGTPWSNSMETYWQMTRPIMGDTLAKTRWEFLNKHFVDVSRSQKFYTWKIRDGETEKIIAACAQKVRSWTAAECLGVDKVIERTRYITMLPETYTRSDAIANERSVTIGEDIKPAEAATVVGQLRQLSAGGLYQHEMKALPDDRAVPVISGYDYYDDTKIREVRAIQEQHDAPIIVAYQFDFEREKLLEALPDARVADDDGIRAWNAGRVKFLIANPQSVGHGVNLQHGGNLLVYTSPTYNWELYAQMNERIGPARQKQAGFDRPSIIITLCAKNTVDEDVLEVLANRGKSNDVNTLALRRYQHGAA